MKEKRFRTVYYRCPKCYQLGIYVTNTKFVRCGTKRCEVRFCYIRNQVSRVEYERIMWGE